MEKQEFTPKNKTKKYSNESAKDIHPIINSVLTCPTIQRKAKSNKSKAQQLPKHMTTTEALSILQQKEEKKRRKKLIKEARRQKIKNNFKKY